MIMRYGLYIAGLVVVMVLSLLGTEFALRQTPDLLPVQWQIKLHENSRKHHVIPDETIGFLLQPQQHEHLTNADYDYVKETDAHGFPNREPWPETVDIVFLGDSLITGEGVGIERQFTTLVSRMLSNRPVLNLGVPGAGPERQLEIYRRFGSGLHPRLIVTCWYLISDLMNDTHFRAWRRDSLGLDYNRFRYSYSRRNDLRSSYHPMRVLQRSVLFGKIDEWMRDGFGNSSVNSQRWQFDDGSDVLLDRAKINLATTAATTDDLRIERTMASLAGLQKLAESQHAELLVMLIPSKEELYGLPPENISHSIIAQVRERLTTQPVTVLDLYRALRQAGIRRTMFYRRDSHLNDDGNRLVAETFVSWWREKWPQRS